MSSSTEPLSVAVASDLADMVRDRVKSGAYHTESDVVSEGLRVLKERDDGVERWLRDEVANTYEAYRRDPTRVISADAVFGGLEARYSERDAAKHSSE